MNNSFGVSAFDLTNYNLALNLNFGNKNPDTTYGALTAIYRGLAQAFGPAYYYEIQNNTLNSPARYAETQNVLRSLQAVEQNQWYMNQNLISSDSYLSNINSKLTTQNSYLSTQNSLLYDYNHVGNDSFSVGSTSRNTAVNTQSLNNINWTTGNSLVNITDPNGNVISQGSSIAPPYCDFHFGSYNSVIDAVYKFSLAISAYSYRSINTFIDHVEVLNGTADFEPIIVNHYYSGQNAIVNVVFSNLNTNTRDLILRVYLNDYGYASRTDSYMYYITTDNIDYYSVSDNALLRGILEKDFTATIDGSDLEVNINDSVNVTPIELDVQIGINDFTEVNTISNKLRTWLSTGVGVSALIGALDQLDDSFFTLHNRNVIETINSGYTDFYD